MTVTLTVTDDRAEYDATRARLEGFTLAAMVGLHSEELATRGHRHEVGEGVPPRPFMGPSFDAAEPRLTTSMVREAGEVSDGATTAADAVKGVGEQAEEAIKLYVEGGQVGGKALSEAAKKRDTRKIIDSGATIGAVNTKLVRTSEAER